MKLEMLTYEDLTEEERADAPNNGHGAVAARYLRVQFNPNEKNVVYSDAMEPEDATFMRDLNWVLDAVSTAFEAGLRQGAAEAMGKPLED